MKNNLFSIPSSLQEGDSSLFLKNKRVIDTLDLSKAKDDFTKVTNQLSLFDEFNIHIKGKYSFAFDLDEMDKKVEILERVIQSLQDVKTIVFFKSILAYRNDNHIDNCFYNEIPIIDILKYNYTLDRGKYIKEEYKREFLKKVIDLSKIKIQLLTKTTKGQKTITHYKEIKLIHFIGFEYSDEMDIKSLDKISFELFLGLSPDEKKELEKNFRLESKNTLKIKQSDDSQDHYFKSFVSQQVNFIANSDKPKAISKQKLLEQSNINLNQESKNINKLLKKKLQQLIQDDIINDWYVIDKNNKQSQIFGKANMIYLKK